MEKKRTKKKIALKKNIKSHSLLFVSSIEKKTEKERKSERVREGEKERERFK